MRRSVYCLGGIFIFCLAAPSLAQNFDLPKLEKCRDFSLETDLSKGGCIVIPDDEQYKEMAGELNASLKSLGIENFNITTDKKIGLEKGQCAIAIGHMMNNSLIENLYWNRYTFVDPSHPGKNGYVIETVHQPMPWYAENNVVILGASTFENARYATMTFLEKFASAENQTLKPILETYGMKSEKGQEEYFLRMRRLRGFGGMAKLYQLTGNKEYLNTAIELLDEHVTNAENDPNWILMWPDEIDSFRAICAWDAVQEHAHLSEADNLRFEQFFLDLINKLSEKTDILGGEIKPGLRHAWNHTTIPLLGMYASSRYYKAHYGLACADNILNQAQWYFMGQAPNYRTSCDAFFYSTFSLQYCLSYYVMTDQLEYFENGNARKMANLLFSQLDNNGFVGGTGDCSSFRTAGRSLAWDILDYKLKLSELNWFNKQCRARAANCVSKFYPDMQPQCPEFLEGSVSIQMEKGYYEHIRSKGASHMMDLFSLPKIPPTVPYELAFDKLQFRSFGPDGGEYLLVDGFGRGNHGHIDTGAIVAATLDGYRFLCDADYLVSKSNEHSMVSVVKDGKAELPVPPFAGLTHKFNFEKGAYTSIKVPNYNDTTWDRHILWFKSRYFVVVDALTAEKPGEFKFDCVWKVLSRGMEQFDGKELICKAPKKGVDRIIDFSEKTFRLRSVDEGDWDRRQSEDNTVTRKVHQVKTVDMKTGDRVAYQNLFFVERPDGNQKIQQYHPQRISDTSLIVNSDTPAIVVIGKQAVGDLDIDADLAYLSGTEALFVNVRSIQSNGNNLLRSTKPVNIWIEGDEITIEASDNGKLSLLLGDVDCEMNFSMGTTTSKLNSQFSYTVRPEMFKSSYKDQSDNSAVEMALWDPLWMTPGQSDNFEQDICAGDINEDGQIEVLAATDKLLTCYDGTGKKCWQYESPTQLMSCEIVGAGKGSDIKVLAGTSELGLIGFDAEGKVVKTITIEPKSMSSHGLRGEPWVTHIRCHDLNHDGQQEVIVGTRKWLICVFDSNLDSLGDTTALHGVADIKFGTLRQEVEPFYFGDKYGGAYEFNMTTDKKEVLRKQSFTCIGDVSIAVADLNNDGVDDIINASDGGRMSAYSCGKREKLWTLDNYGFGYSCIALTHEKTPVLVTSSDSGYMFFVDPFNGVVQSYVDVGEPVKTFSVTDSNKIIAGTQNGSVVLIVDAKIVKRAHLGKKILKIKPLSDSRVAAMTIEGQVAVFDLD